MTTTEKKIEQYLFPFNGQTFVCRPASNGGFNVYYRFAARPNEMVWIGCSSTNRPDDIVGAIVYAKRRGEF